MFRTKNASLKYPVNNIPVEPVRLSSGKVKAGVATAVAASVLGIYAYAPQSFRERLATVNNPVASLAARFLGQDLTTWDMANCVSKYKAGDNYFTMGINAPSFGRHSTSGATVCFPNDFDSGVWGFMPASQLEGGKYLVGVYVWKGPRPFSSTNEVAEVHTDQGAFEINQNGVMNDWRTEGQKVTSAGNSPSLNLLRNLALKARSKVFRL